MRVSEGDRGLLVELQVVLAWKRWKGLQNPAGVQRRLRAAREGHKDAFVSSEQLGKAHREWIAAGGRK